MNCGVDWCVKVAVSSVEEIRASNHKEAIVVYAGLELWWNSYVRCALYRMNRISMMGSDVFRWIPYQRTMLSPHGSLVIERDVPCKSSLFWMCSTWTHMCGRVAFRGEYGSYDDCYDGWYFFRIAIQVPVRRQFRPPGGRLRPRRSIWFNKLTIQS